MTRFQYVIDRLHEPAPKRSRFAAIHTLFLACVAFTAPALAYAVFDAMQRGY